MKKKRDALLTKMMEMKPEGLEDFWVFSIVVDDGPAWDARFDSVGTYDEAARQCVAMTHAAVENGYKKFEIQTFQGDGARKYLYEAARQESRYQEERNAQPNN
jgi:hypothetical protein